MEAWRLGGMEARRLGGMEAWRFGGLEAWKPGGMEAWSLDAWMHGSLELRAWEKRANTSCVHRFLTHCSACKAFVPGAVLKYFCVQNRLSCTHSWLAIDLERW